MMRRTRIHFSESRLIRSARTSGVLPIGVSRLPTTIPQLRRINGARGFFRSHAMISRDVPAGA
jgi:hypothetical protein